MAQLESHYAELRAAGLGVVCIAQGELKHLRRYCGKLAPSLTCLTDETTQPYYAYGLQQGSVSQLISPDVIMAGIRAYSHGHFNGQVIGDAKMLSGNFIIDRQGIIRYAYYANYAGDNPKLSAVIAVARELQAAGQ